MPDVTIIVSLEDAEILRPHIKTVIGPALRMATAKVFPDLEDNAKKVSVSLTPYLEGDNVPPVRINGIASWSEARLAILEDWRKTLSLAWCNVMYTPELRKNLRTLTLSTSEVYVSLVQGSFGKILAPATDHGG